MLHRLRLARIVLALTLSILLSAQDVFARGGGGGGGRGGMGAGGGARGGGGGAGFGGGGAGGRGGAGGGGGRPMNPGASHAGGAGGAGGNRGAGGGAGREGGIGERNVGGGAGNREGIGGEGARGGENAGIGNRSNTNANRGNTNKANINNGNINAGNTTNVNRGGNTYNQYGNNYGHNGYNNYWHSGYWPGYHPYGYGWGAAATAGMVGWGLGSMASSSGYGGGYSNPYYSSSQASVGTNYDYSQPIQQAPADNQNPGAPPSPEQSVALKSFDAARESFKAGNFETALTKVDEALKQLPNDAALHEFRGLVLFAMARYQESASTIYAVLSAGPGWNWTTLSSMYASTDDYTKQLRALESYAKQHPESPDAAFLLSYHYLTCGYNDQAAKMLKIVIKLLPDDRLAPQLLQMVSGNSPTPQPPATGDAAPAADAAPAGAEQSSAGPPIDKAKLIGTWKASPSKGVAIELTLKGDASFAWKVTQSGKPNLIEGQYATENDQLTLTQKSNGESMVGRVVFADNGGFNFKLVETGPGDPGLNFTK